MNYSIVFKSSVKRDIRHLPQAVILRIKQIAVDLSTKPLPQKAEKLRGYQNIYRIRFSQYRIVYQINNSSKTVTIIKINHRKDIYR